MVEDGPALRFAPTAPTRPITTRRGGSLQAGEVRQLSTAHRGAGALATTITVTNPIGDGYLSAWNCDGARPETSVANFAKGATRASGTIVPLNANGDFCVVASVGTDVIVDEAGEYSPVAGGGLVTVPPTRLVDTRSGRNPNFGAGETVANLATVRVDAAGLCIAASASTHVIVDLLGWYSPTVGDCTNPSFPFDFSIREVASADGTAAPRPTKPLISRWAPRHRVTR
jgi:hypothetical protein